MFPLYAINNVTTGTTRCYRHDGKSGLLAFRTRRAAADEVRQTLASRPAADVLEVEEITNGEKLQELLHALGEHLVWVVAPDPIPEPITDGQHKHGKRNPAVQTHNG